MTPTRRGFTLVEILIALAVLALGIVSLFNIFPSAWHSFAYSRKINQVTLIAQQKLEELKSVEHPAPGSTAGTDADVAWSLSVASKTLPPGVDVLQAELTLTFSLQGKEYAEKFITYIRK